MSTPLACTVALLCTLLRAGHGNNQQRQAEQRQSGEDGSGATARAPGELPHQRQARVFDGRERTATTAPQQQQRQHGQQPQQLRIGESEHRHFRGDGGAGTGAAVVSTKCRALASSPCISSPLKDQRANFARSQNFRNSLKDGS